MSTGTTRKSPRMTSIGVMNSQPAACCRPAGPCPRRRGLLTRAGFVGTFVLRVVTTSYLSASSTDCRLVWTELRMAFGSPVSRPSSWALKSVMTSEAPLALTTFCA